MKNRTASSRGLEFNVNNIASYGKGEVQQVDATDTGNQELAETLDNQELAQTKFDGSEGEAPSCSMAVLLLEYMIFINALL